MAQPSSSYLSKDESRMWGIGWAALYTIVLIIFLFWGLTAANYQHQFDLGNPSGMLQSQRWSFNFWITALSVLLIAPPVAFLAFLVLPTRKKYLFHQGVLIVLIAWFGFSFILGIIQWANANRPDTPHNPANDERWCCAYFNQPGAGTKCANTVPTLPCPGVGPSTLITNKRHLWQLWFQFVFVGFMGIQMVFMNVLSSAFTPEMRGSDDDETRPLMSKIGGSTGSGSGYRGREHLKKFNY